MNEKLVAVLFGFVIVMSSSIPLVFASKPSLPPIMNNAGQLITLNENQFRAVAAFPTTNLRMAIFDGNDWMEIPFQVRTTAPVIGSVVNSSSRPLSTQPPPVIQQGSSALTFLMPQLIGQEATMSNWWNIATDLKMSSRVSFVLADSGGHQTVLYIYFRTTGFAPAPTFTGFATVGANSPLLNGTSVAPQSQGSALALSPLSISSVQTSSKPSAADPTVYDHENVNTPDPGTIQYPGLGSGGHGTKDYYVEIPVSRNYGHLTISVQSHNECCSRYLQVYVNNHAIFSDNGGQGKVVIGGEFFDVDVSSYLCSTDISNKCLSSPPADPSNNINKFGVSISTWVSYAYWTFSSKTNIGYSAQSHIESGVSAYSPNYNFQNTGSNTQYFSARVPNATASPTYLQVQFTSYGDNNDRCWAVYVNGRQISPSNSVCGTTADFQLMTSCNSGNSLCWTSSDITNLVEYQPTVQVGIYLSTYTTNWYWQVWGNMNFASRYQVWPDSDSRWTSNWHPLGTMTASLYDITAPGCGLGCHPDKLLGPVSVGLKSQEYDQKPFMYLAVTTHIPSDIANQYCSGCAYGMVIWQYAHVSVSGLTGTSFISGTLVSSPTNTGSDTYDTGQLVLSGAIILATALPSDYIIPAQLALTLIKYLVAGNPSNCVYETKTDSTGVYFTDNRCAQDFSPYNDLSDQIGFLVNVGYHGSYVVTVQTTVQARVYYLNDYGYPAIYALPSIQFTFTCTYTY